MAQLDAALSSQLDQGDAGLVEQVCIGEKSYRVVLYGGVDVDRSHDEAAMVLVARPVFTVRLKMIYSPLAQSSGESWSSNWDRWVSCDRNNAHHKSIASNGAQSKWPRPLHR